MKIHTDHGQQMADAIHQVFGHLAVFVEGYVFHTAGECSADYQGGSWAFVANDEGTLGFWYPLGQASFAVSVADNYFQHPTMHAMDFGAACTLVGLNHLIWKLHADGHDVDAISTKFHALRNWIFDLGEDPEPVIDTAHVAGFID